jgi:hypothetical protein
MEAKDIHIQEMLPIWDGSISYNFTTWTRKASLLGPTQASILSVQEVF